ncbi:MAG: hypothetical protein AAF318_06105 [Pseudomonadota bacterium]
MAKARARSYSGAMTVLSALRLLHAPLAALCVVLVLGHALIPHSGSASAMCIGGVLTTDGGSDHSAGDCPLCSALPGLPPAPHAAMAAAPAQTLCPAVTTATLRRATAQLPVGARAPPL